LGSVVDKAALEHVSSEYFSFPCLSFIAPIAVKSSPPNIQGWYNQKIHSSPLSELKNHHRSMEIFPVNDGVEFLKWSFVS
jgi:hypothetical protein